MSFINNSKQNLPRNPNEGAGGALWGLGSLALLIYFISSAAAMFAASLIAGFAVIVVIAISIALGIPVYRRTCKRRLVGSELLAESVGRFVGRVACHCVRVVAAAARGRWAATAATEIVEPITRQRVCHSRWRRHAATLSSLFLRGPWRRGFCPPRTARSVRFTWVR